MLGRITLIAVLIVELSATALTAQTLPPTITEFPVPTPSSGPTSIAAGPDGNLWFTESSAWKIGRMTTGGTFVEGRPPGHKSCSMRSRFSQLDSDTSRNALLEQSHWPARAGTSKAPGGRVTVPTTLTSHARSVSAAHPAPIVTFPFPTASDMVGGITTGPDGNAWFTA